MIQAELHGHASRDIQGNEDYLTSAVFEHLRYVPPHVFWQDLFSRVRGSCSGRSLLEYLACVGAQPSAYTSLAVTFWPNHPELGTPDLCLWFSGAGRRPCIIIIEAKLWAGKSGTGDNDQLLRYLLLLDRVHELQLPFAEAEVRCAAKALLFLTPHDAAAEVMETIALCGSRPELVPLLFTVQWQDITAATSAAALTASGQVCVILADMASFLRRRNLEYFSGFARADVPSVAVSGAFYERTTIFHRLPIPSLDVEAGSFYRQRGRH